MKLLASCLLLALLQTCGLQKVEHNSDLTSRITMTLHLADCANNPNGTRLHFPSLTGFEWDKLYVVGAYQSIGDLQLNTGIDIDRIGDHSIRYGKLNQHVLIFTHNKKIVSYVKYPRSGDFDNIINIKQGYSPKEAIFMVCERGDSTINGEAIYQITKDDLEVVDTTTPHNNKTEEK